MGHDADRIVIQRRDQRRHGSRVGIAAHIDAGNLRREQLMQFFSLKRHSDPGLHSAALARAGAAARSSPTMKAGFTQHMVWISAAVQPKAVM